MSEVTRTTVSITVNGRSVDVTPGEMLIDAAEKAGEYIPRFCYHPRMEPVGVCRMCLVEVDGPRGPALTPACYIKVTDGMNVVTNSEKVKKVQDGVLEFLLANHPLDCPVCDKGGECPLQDQALAHGSGETRFIEEKRHFVKPISIGENVLLDRERCIQCSRCTRFASEVAGEAEIAFAGRGDNIEVAPSPTTPFDSVFSGNTVQICPVGALTAKPYRFTARPWDLEQVESTCTTCAVGCRVAVQSSGNRLTRVLGVDSEPVNHGWLCDKGRFSLDSVDGNEGATDVLSAKTRISEPMVRRNGQLVATTWSEALRAAADVLRAGMENDGVGVIGGAALTNEGAFAWERFARGVLGTENIDAQYGDGLNAALLQSLPTATIDEAVAAATVVTLSGDLREELPVLYLRLREAITKKKHALVELRTNASALSALATVSLPLRAGEAHLAAQALGSGVVPHEALYGDDELSTARGLIGATGDGVVFVVGRPNLAEGPEVMEAAVRALAAQFPAAKFLPALKRANVFGALDMGLAPQLRPGRGYDANVTGRDTLAQLAAMRAGTQRATLLLGGCLLGNVLDVAGAREALEKSSVVAVTGHGGKTLACADVVLPALVQHERSGTVTNIEGRVSAVVAKLVGPGSAWDDVAIAAELSEEFGQYLGLSSVMQTAETIEATVGYPAALVMTDVTGDGVVAGRNETPSPRSAMDPMAFPGIRSAESVGLGARAGVTAASNHATGTAPVSATLATLGAGETPDVPLADAYALRLVVARRLYDHGVSVQGAPALTGLVAPAALAINHFDLDRMGVASGTALLVKGPRGQLNLPVVLDDGVPRGAASLVFGARDENSVDVVDALVGPVAVTTQIRLETR